MRDSAETFGTGKRPLTEVKEEPQEKEDDFEMVSGGNEKQGFKGQDYEGMTMLTVAITNIRGGP